jgi:Zn-dependent protease
MPPTFYLFEPLAVMARVSVSLNFALGIFNLVPLPPLDGSKIVESFLSLEATRKYEQLAQYSFFILMALLISGAFSILEYPIRMSSGLTLVLMGRIFGLPEAIL